MGRQFCEFILPDLRVEFRAFPVAAAESNALKLLNLGPLGLVAVLFARGQKDSPPRSSSALLGIFFAAQPLDARNIS